MFAMRLWVSVAFLSFLNLHNAAAQSQMCSEPFQAVMTVLSNVTLPISTDFLDPDLVFYRKVLHFTEEEIDRDREAAMQFFRDTYGLDFTNIEPNEQGQRTLGNATMEPFTFPFNFTYVFNSWLVNGKTRTRCFPVGEGGFHVRFTGTMMLHREYGGEEGKLVIATDRLFYRHQYVYEACKQQGIIFQVESIAPLQVTASNQGGFVVYNFRARNRVLGEGTVWGVGRGTPVDSLNYRLEVRYIYTFL